MDAVLRAWLYQRIGESHFEFDMDMLYDLEQVIKEDN